MHFRPRFLRRPKIGLERRFETGWLAFERGEVGKAIEIWRSLASVGHTRAQYGLGLISIGGHADQPPNMAEAAEWMRKAADGGLALAVTTLGRMHELGQHFDRDAVEAASLYTRSAHAGEVYAQIYLGSLHERGEGVAKDSDQAFLWYRKAAEHGGEDVLAVLHDVALGDFGPAN